MAKNRPFCWTHFFICQLWGDVTTVFLFVNAISFLLMCCSGIKLQNEVLERCLKENFMELCLFLSNWVAEQKNMGKILNFEKSAKMEQKMIFLKIFKNTPKKSKTRARLKMYIKPLIFLLNVFFIIMWCMSTLWK